jgi:putative transcriptional regulator
MMVRTGDRPGRSVEVIDGVWVSHDREMLERFAAEEEREVEFRLYAGYAGWAPGQLDVEVSRGDWFVVAADADTVFSDHPARVWRSLLPARANPYVTQVLPASREPSSGFCPIRVVFAIDRR